MTLVETMARAICVEMQCFDYGNENDDGDFVTTEAKIKLLEARCKDAALAALKAMREPTEAMLEASNREWDGRMSARSAGVWQAMVDAALTESQEQT
jgi:hypothetical protein